MTLRPISTGVGNNEGKGFWGMIRLLMPVVEAVGYVQYKELGTGRKRASKVLEDLNVPFPNLSWLLFRNCLLHGDEILPLVNQEQEKYAGWRLSWGGSHSSVDKEIVIDIEKLYYDLYAYIEQLIEGSKPEETVTLEATHLSKKLLKNDEAVRKEYERLFSYIPVRQNERT